MTEKGPQQSLVVADREYGQMVLHGQVVELDWCKVGEAVGLGMAPDELDRIEFGCRRRSTRRA